MIEYLSIDLETKSGTDLSKSGVYRYTEDPEFEILLFGYSVNGGEVSVIDVACGEQIPEKGTVRIPVNTGKMHFFDPDTTNAIRKEGK